MVAVFVSRRPWPRARWAVVALLALALFAIWTLVSFTWAPLAGSAYDAGQIAFLYLGGMIAAVALLRGREARVLEPAVAAGALVVIGYALAERVLPGLLHYQHSVSARGTARAATDVLERDRGTGRDRARRAARGWPAMCAARPTVRAGFAAGAAPLGVGLYLSFSRGALFACFVGLLTLLVLLPGPPGMAGSRRECRGRSAAGGAVSRAAVGRDVAVRLGAPARTRGSDSAARTHRRRRRSRRRHPRDRPPRAERGGSTPRGSVSLAARGQSPGP